MEAGVGAEIDLASGGGGELIAPIGGEEVEHKCECCERGECQRAHRFYRYLDVLKVTQSEEAREVTERDVGAGEANCSDRSAEQASRVVLREQGCAEQRFEHGGAKQKSGLQQCGLR